MILAIDIGNTNIVVGCIDDKKTYFIERLFQNNHAFFRPSCDAGIRWALESAAPTAPVITVEEIISQTALIPTIRQQPIIML